jgi:hypothetical protein
MHHVTGTTLMATSEADVKVSLLPEGLEEEAKTTRKPSTLAFTTEMFQFAWGRK